MEASELRLGNLFIAENSKEIIKVIGLEKENITFSGNFVGKWQAKPISLTEEWLLKFGFDSHGKIENEMFIFQIIFHDCYHITYKEKEGYGIGECFLQGYPSVHQLQNLYFALTGEELTEKEQ